MKKLVKYVLTGIGLFVWIILFWCAAFTALFGEILETITGISLLVGLLAIMAFYVYHKDCKGE